MSSENRTVKYCWVNSEVWRWNESSPENILPENKEHPKFRHSLGLVLELQDDDRKFIKEVNCIIVLETTDSMLTVTEQRTYQASQDVQDRIQEEIAKLKSEYAGYDGGASAH